MADPAAERDGAATALAAESAQGRAREAAAMLARFGAPHGRPCVNCAHATEMARGHYVCGNRDGDRFGHEVAPGDGCRYFAASA